jgi:hypothetical protein
MKGNTRKQQRRNEKEDKRQRPMPPSQENTVAIRIPNTEEARNYLISQMSPGQRKSTSYHESAHAIFDVLCDIPVEFCTALPYYSENYGGWVFGCSVTGVINSTNVLTYVNGGIKGLLAADLAQEKAAPGRRTSEERKGHCAGDLHSIERIAAAINEMEGTKYTVEELIVKYTLEVTAMLDDPGVWAAVEALAARLQEVEVVQGDEVRRIISRCCGAAKVAGA